jgi:hypothetical protein
MVMAMGAVALTMLNALVPPVMVPLLTMPPLMVEASTKKASSPAVMVPLLLLVTPPVSSVFAPSAWM